MLPRSPVSGSSLPSPSVGGALRVLALAALAGGALAAPAAAAVQLEVRHGGVLIPKGGTHDFGEALVGTQPVFTLTVENVDTSPVHISSVGIGYNGNDPGRFSIASNGLGVLDPGEIGTLDLRFHADEVGGPVTNEVELLVGGIPRWHFDVRATIVEPPDLSLIGGIYSLPISHNGAYAAGTLYLNQETWVPFFITNDGGSALDVSQIDWTGNRIAEVSGPAGPIPPGETGGFSLHLKTDIPGSYNPQVRIHSDDPSPQPFAFYVSWTVSGQVGPVLRLQLGGTVIGNGQTVSFGTTGVGTTVSRTFTVFNDGDQPLLLMLSIGQSTTDPGTFQVGHQSPGEVPPGGSTTFRIDYDAEALGTSNASIDLDIFGQPPPFELFVTCTASPPDFSVDVSPGSRTVAPGQNADYTVDTEALYGFSGTLSLGASSLPAGTTATFTPQSVAAGGTSQLRIATTGSTPPTIKTFTVTATNGGNSRSDTAQIVIQNPIDFTLTVTPEVRTIVPGGQAAYTVSVDPVNGFSSNVSLSVSGLPAGASHQLTPQVVDPGESATLFVTTATSSPMDDHPLTVTGTGGGRTHSDEVTLRLVPPGGEPRVDAVVPAEILAGGVRRITLHGQNFEGAFVEVATTPAEPGDPVPAVFPDLAMVGVSGDGTRLVVDVDATGPGVKGFYNLAIETAGGTAGAPFRVIGPGPEVDVWTPQEPARGHTYSLSMMGINLAGATLSVSGGGGVTPYVLASGPRQLTGFLDVAADAPTGPRTLVVHRNGHQTQVPITVVASLEESALGTIDVTQEAALKAAAVGERVPEILLQDFSLREDLAWSGGGLSGSGEGAPTLQTKGVCNGIISWQIYRDAFVVALPFDPGSGRVLFDILRNMELGVPVPVGVRILSGFADLLIVARFNCFPVSHIQICLYGNLGFEITGVGGQIFSAGGCFFGGTFFPVLSTTGILGDFQFRTDTECTTVSPLPPLPLEEPEAEVTKNGCCSEDLRIDATGQAFAGSIYQFGFSAQNTGITQTTPAPGQCVCPASVALDPLALQPGQSGQLKARVRNNGPDPCTYNWTLGQMGNTGPPVSLSPTSGSITLDPNQIQELSFQASIPPQFPNAQSPDLQLSVSPQGTNTHYLGPGRMCVLPTGETSTFLGWAEPFWDRAQFQGNVLPGSIDWSTEAVTEDPIGSGTGTTDTCWFLGSALPRYTDQNSISGGTWQLDASGAFIGADTIGMSADVDAYYSANNRTPCTLGTTQHMKRVCPGAQRPEYEENVFLWFVTSGGTTICRDLACSTPN